MGKVEVYKLTEKDKKLVRENKILMENHPTRIFLFNAKFPDGTIRVIEKREILAIWLEDNK